MIPKNITVLRDGNNLTAKTAKGCIFSDDVLEVFGEGHSAILANDKTKVHFLFLSDMASLNKIADTLWDYQIFSLGDGAVSGCKEENDCQTPMWCRGKNVCPKAQQVKG